MTENEVVLVTGARKGIGRFMVEHFVREGALVEGCSREPADWTLDGYTHHLVDVSDETQVKSMISSIRRRHDRLDILINNAGIASMNHALLTPTETVDRIMATNFRGSFIMCRESAKIMKKKGGVRPDRQHRVGGGAAAVGGGGGVCLLEECHRGPHEDSGP